MKSPIQLVNKVYIIFSYIENDSDKLNFIHKQS